MRLRGRSSIGSLSILIVSALSIAQSQACARHPPPSGENNSPAGEPEQYRATVVRTIDDGSRFEVSTTREFRSGEMRREEWTEQGHHRALIWGPNATTGILLDLDAQAYSEVEITPASADVANANGRGRIGRQDPLTIGAESNALQAIDRAVDDAPSPDRVETRELPGEVIAGHRCSVSEQRATFPDGHTEITTSYRALDLRGLALKIEITSEPGAVKLITERRDVIVDVPSDVFAVPPSYKKMPR